MSRPKVILHNEMSLDGRITGFNVDMERYYRIAGELGADGVLSGSNTVLTAIPEIPPETEADMKRPLTFDNGELPWFFIVDSSGRVRSHHVFRELPFIRDVAVIASDETPEEYMSYLKEREYGCIKTGERKVDLEKALDVIGDEYGVRKIRVDSGGGLNSVLLREGLVDELSLIIDPLLVGKEGPTVFGDLDRQDPSILELNRVEELEDGALHIVYSVAGKE